MNKVRTRFAPSPTGLLHIGGARTALFNWLYAKQHNGEFILRLEDTDAARSSEKFATSIMEDMQWLGLQWHGEVQKQTARASRHREAAMQLLQSGAAYQCYCTPQELTTMREQQLARGESPKYDRRWRDSKQTPPPDVKPALRIKMPPHGESVYEDAIKGAMSVSRAELDDFVILRANGEPTYNLANVVDDIDGNITHVIRGDDHLMNTHRQLQLFAAFNAAPPVFAHLPMILSRAHNENGEPLNDDKGEAIYERMSKRESSAGISECRARGFLPAAMINYLARLSWSHGDAEMFDTNFLLKHFSLASISHSPARHNAEKLLWLNREHLRALPPSELTDLTNNFPGRYNAEKPFWLNREHLCGPDNDVIDMAMEPVKYAMSPPPIKINGGIAALIQPRAETLSDMVTMSSFFRARPSPDKALLSRHPVPESFPTLVSALESLSDWTASEIKGAIKKVSKEAGIKFPALGMPMRVLLTGAEESPDIAATAALLGKEETLARLNQSRV